MEYILALCGKMTHLFTIHSFLAM